MGYTSEPTIHGPQADDERTYELLLFGPDELGIFITDTRITHSPFRTTLDTDPQRVHSEILQLCWVVADKESEREFLADEAGMVLLGENHPENDEMQRLMFTPRNSPLQCSGISDAAQRRKIELMSYPEEALEPRPQWPLRGGFYAGAYYVDDIISTMSQLPSASFGEVVVADEGAGERRAVHGVSPAGAVHFELWETKPGKSN